MKNVGGAMPVVKDGQNMPLLLVGIELIDLLNIGGGEALPPSPSVSGIPGIHARAHVQLHPRLLYSVWDHPFRTSAS